MAGRTEELRRRLEDAGACRSLAAAIAHAEWHRLRTLAGQALQAGMPKPEVAQLARLSVAQLDELLATPPTESSKPH